MVSGYPTSISFPWVDDWSTDPPSFGASHSVGAEIYDIHGYFAG